MKLSRPNHPPNSPHEGPEDTLYAEPLESVDNFRFDGQVAQVFADMIHRSVPGYASLLQLISSIAHQYLQPNSRCYDLGCSLGASSLAVLQGLAQRTDAPALQLIAMDNSSAMVERCQATLTQYQAEHLPSQVSIQVLEQDINTTEFAQASLVLLNFTLQFISPAQRLDLLKRIYAGMNPGAVLLLSEKIRFTDAEEQSFLQDMHLQFKRFNGYSELEISQKRAALEQVLKPDTLAQHQERLAEAGFSACHLWFQCCNFISILAHK